MLWDFDWFLSCEIVFMCFSICRLLLLFLYRFCGEKLYVICVVKIGSESRLCNGLCDCWILLFVFVLFAGYVLIVAAARVW